MVCSLHVPSFMAICAVCFAFSCCDEIHLQHAGGCAAPKSARYFSAELWTFVSLGLRATGRQIRQTRGYSTANTAQYSCRVLVWYTARRRTAQQPKRVFGQTPPCITVSSTGHRGAEYEIIGIPDSVFKFHVLGCHVSFLSTTAQNWALQPGSEPDPQTEHEIFREFFFIMLRRWMLRCDAAFWLRRLRSQHNGNGESADSTRDRKNHERAWDRVLSVDLVSHSRPPHQPENLTRTWWRNIFTRPTHTTWNTGGQCLLHKAWRERLLERFQPFVNPDHNKYPEELFRESESQSGRSI